MMIQKTLGFIKYQMGMKVPLKIAHYVTYRCNLQCEMCGRRLIPSVDELTTEQAISLQKDFRKHGTIVWSFSGGECLLRNDIIDLSLSVKELGMDLIIVTNGLLLPKKPEIADIADIINISIDGNRTTHDHLRGRGNYDKAIRGLEVLSESSKLKKRVINVILNNETIEIPVLNHLLNLAQEYNCQLGFNPIIVHRSDIRGGICKTFFPTNEQFKTFIKWIKNKKNSEYSKYLVDSPSFFTNIGNYPLSPTRIKCYAGKLQASIDPYGRVLPCSDFFDYENNYKKYNWGYGYPAFKSLKRQKCQYEFCCTAKKNYFFSHPLLLIKEFVYEKK